MYAVNWTLHRKVEENPNYKLSFLLPTSVYLPTFNPLRSRDPADLAVSGCIHTGV